MIDENKRKEILNLADTMQGEINRMCVTDDFEELWKMEKYLILNAHKMWEMNHDRIVANHE